MRIVLKWLDQLRRTTVDGLPAFAAALVAQLDEIAKAANAWAATDHDSDGTHAVVRVGHEDAPAATTGKITLYTTDGQTLNVVKADGTIGTVTIV